MGNNGSLYFKYPTTLSTIIILTTGSSKGKDTQALIILVLVIQKQTITIKAPDIFYRDQAKLNNFFIFIDIYILFNQYLFGSKLAKVIYIISYFRGITFN
jgi:hypothetical protein